MDNLMEKSLIVDSVSGKAEGKPRADTRSAALLVFFLLMTLIFLMAARSPIDSDLFWHLRAGKETIQQGHPLLVDVMSFTRTGASWTNHSWLAQVFLYLLYQWGGFFAIGALVAAMATVSMAFVYFSMDGPALMRGFLVILAALVAAWVWSARPQVFSLALFSAVGWILYQYKWKKRDFLWTLIPLFILWSNLHAGYVLGLLLLGAFLAGEILNRLVWNPAGETLPVRGIGRLAVWSLISGCAVLINPNGIQTWLEPFRTVEVGAIQTLISEWASPDFHAIGQQTMLILFFLGLVAFCFSRKRVDGTDLVPFILFGYMAFVARRNFGPFALAAAPGISRALYSAGQAWWEEFGKRYPQAQSMLLERIRIGQGKPLPGALRKTINLGLVGAFAFIAVMKLYAVSAPPVMGYYLPQYYPVGAVAWIEANKPAGPMFNSYDWGGYLTWALPEYPVFIDGRTDLYNDVLINAWLGAANADPGWEDTLNRWNIHVVLLEPSRPLAKVLAGSGWKLYYQDKLAVIYGR
jgi:hypothetical protein